MKLHPAGKEIIVAVSLILGVTALLAIRFIPFKMFWLIYLVLFFLLIIEIWVLSFFRYPNRNIKDYDKNNIYSAADGKVVVVEKIKSNNFSEGEAIQISVFMSIYSVHINYLPVSGKIISKKHKKGKHLMAIKPKASLENEQCETEILGYNDNKIIVRQIAGAAARRVLTFVEANENVITGQELGFIRFGSRVDHIIPINSKVNVSIGDKVKGCKTILAELS